MLRGAFNFLTKRHSRAAVLRRPGSPAFYSPCRITPANFSRFQQVVENVISKGREFILPADSVLGQYAQTLTFDGLPDDGQFKLTFSQGTTAFINYDATAAQIQTAVRLVSGLSNVTVTGSFAAGLVVTFVGFSEAQTLITLTSNTLVMGLVDVDAVVAQSYTAFPTPSVKRGDMLIDSGIGSMTVDEVVEIYDFGGAIMGWRLRAD